VRIEAVVESLRRDVLDYFIRLWRMKTEFVQQTASADVLVLSDMLLARFFAVFAVRDHLTQRVCDHRVSSKYSVWHFTSFSYSSLMVLRAGRSLLQLVGT
jgi:hypothetical protein